MTSQETVESIREQLADENPKALYADGFDGALVGIARRCGQPSLAVYSRAKCIQILAKEMTQDEAEEYFEFNVGGSWVGENTPIFMDVF
jgi:hypothetical protein